MDEAYITPEKAYEIPILRILIEKGGKATNQEVYSDLEKIMEFTPGDRQFRPDSDSREIIWKNNAAWARQKLVKNGELDNSVRGVWAITEKGKLRYEREGPNYKQSNYPPYIPKARRRGKRKAKAQLIHPDRVTPEFLQKWGVEQGLNLFELGFEGVKRKYETFYHRQRQLDDNHLLKIVKELVANIRAFLDGSRDVKPSEEQLCQWVDFCYLLQLYSEGYELFQRLSPGTVYEELYQRTKKIAQACQHHVL